MHNMKQNTLLSQYKIKHFESMHCEKSLVLLSVGQTNQAVAKQGSILWINSTMGEITLI